ncbi:hypothetical protein [Pedobacter sp. UBA4863]|uniref:hypothetical protein n=1 Tax=Pedobacter sp. UBA4863 TaxID=1947060 RepID=UPI0025D80E05|nr:hypothetical protein [Pedobacter sp. UBA4863]
MNKQNLLSRAEMKKVMGGYAMPEEVGKDCAFAICSYRGAGGEWVSGSCGSSINGEQCRCIAQDGSSSVPFSGCLA